VFSGLWLGLEVCGRFHWCVCVCVCVCVRERERERVFVEDAVRFWCILRPRDVVGWCADGREESGHLRFFFFFYSCECRRGKRERQTDSQTLRSVFLPSFLSSSGV
jgi:hypothetical protein